MSLWKTCFLMNVINIRLFQRWSKLWDIHRLGENLKVELLFASSSLAQNRLAWVEDMGRITETERERYMYPLRQIKHKCMLKYMLKNLKKRLKRKEKNPHKLCIAQSPTIISSSTRSLQRCVRSQFLIYSYCSADSVSVTTASLSLALDPSSSTSSAAQRKPLSTLMPGWLQGDIEVVHYLITKGNFPPFQAVLMSAVFLLPVSLSPFTIGLCRLPWHITPRSNCHCWAVVTWTSSLCILWYKSRKKENRKHRKTKEKKIIRKDRMMGRNTLSTGK